ncbi:MAG: LysR family transcriptional regulator [Paracoccaceae bacterium]|jgi:DNA-binding transcriptional LysR family regulator|nr:transcriptional regulator, LysR family protein [Rhodobacterales bacterium HTCC2150] [Rhodobacteraceae bacterium HTCC2150]MDG1532443.1 LysR family transcriptional regulator [Paracoccaceae bacterium]
MQPSGKITLWGIEVFLATADEGAISAAARRLGASASAVSQQLTNLEGALGAILLDRSTRPVLLTPAGELFRVRAQTIQNEAMQARAELAMRDISRLTRFRLGMIEEFDAEVTPRLLSDMSVELRQCQFLLETGPSHQLFDHLDTRALDVIVAADMGAAADWMEVHPLIEEPFIAVCPKGAIKGDDTLRELRRMPLIQYTSRHHMGRVIGDHLARQNLTLNQRFELDSYHAIMSMVAAGEGWTIITPLGFMHAHRFLGDVDMLPLPFEPLSRRISLTARKGVLQNMPEKVANELRVLVSKIIIDPLVKDKPWLGDLLKVIS